MVGIPITVVFLILAKTAVIGNTGIGNTGWYTRQALSRILPDTPTVYEERL